MISSREVPPDGRSTESGPDLAKRGYLVVRGLLDPDGTSNARALVESTVSSNVETACARPNNLLVPLRWNHPLVRLFLESRRVVPALRQALGADDLRWISGYISLKEPGSPPLWWHSDWWCWDHPVSFRRDAAQVAVLTYLTPTSPLNGALRILPGSHHRSAPIHALLPEAHSETAGRLPPDHAAFREIPGGVTLSLRAGDAAMIDYRLLHGTHGNPSPARRECVLLTFAPSWRRLPEDLRSHLIQHPALPSDDERRQGLDGVAELLPDYAGERRSLKLNRNAPAQFDMDD